MMKIILYFILTSIICFITCITLLKVKYDVPVDPIVINIPEFLKVGNSVEPYYYCDWRYYNYDDEMTCTYRNVYIRYNLLTGNIIRSYVSIKPTIPVGDFILQWGKPSYIERTYNMIYLYWDDRGVVLYDNSKFSPNSKVSLMFEFLYIEGEYTSWKGFTYN